MTNIGSDLVPPISNRAKSNVKIFASGASILTKGPNP
jgi:hypothetical protein